MGVYIHQNKRGPVYVVACPQPNDAYILQLASSYPDVWAEYQNSNSGMTNHHLDWT